MDTFIPLTDPKTPNIYNPLHFLTSRAIEEIIDCSRNGSISRLQLLFDLVEQSSLTLAMCITRRSSALPDWTIKPRKARKNQKIDKVLQEEQEQFLLKQFFRLEDSGTLTNAIQTLHLAVFRGLGVVQPIYDDEGIQKIVSLNPWNFALGDIGDDGIPTLYWNPEGMDILGKEGLKEIPRDEVIVNYNRLPIDAFGLRYYLVEQLGIESYAKLIARRGLPATYIVAPEDIDPDKIRQWADKAVEASKGGSGCFPFGTQIITQAIDPSNGSTLQAFLDYTQKQIVLASTGGILGSLTASTGLGSNVADVQNDVFKSIVKKDAYIIGDLINRGIAKKLLDWRFPDKKHLVYFDLADDITIDPKTILENAVLAHNAGFKIDERELSEKTGYTITSLDNTTWTPSEKTTVDRVDLYEVGNDAPNAEETIEAKIEGKSDEPEENEEEKIEVLKGFQKWLKPLREMLVKLLHGKATPDDVEAEIKRLENTEEDDFKNAVAKLWASEYEKTLGEENGTEK